MRMTWASARPLASAATAAPRAPNTLFLDMLSLLGVVVACFPHLRAPGPLRPPRDAESCSLAGPRTSRAARDRGAHALRGGRDARDAHADGVRAVRAERIGVLDEVAGDRRDVACGRDEVVVQVVGPATHVLLHEREA